MDPSKIRIRTRRTNVHELKQNFLEGSLSLPDDYVAAQASSKIIESALIQVPLERLWFKLYYKTSPLKMEPLGSYTKRFVASIKHYLIEDNPLTDLIYLKNELENKPLSGLPWAARRIENAVIDTASIGDYLPEEIIADLLTRFPTE